MTLDNIIRCVVLGALATWFLLIDPAMREDSYGEGKK